MKKYGKIIIAFMWLGLTMIMIVGATFAWFSENRNVEANGMQVQAETTSNLLITNSDKASYDYVVNATNTSLTTLSPASTSKATSGVLSAGKFFYADRAKIEYESGAATSETVFTAVAAANIATDGAASAASAASGDTKTYVSENTFYITAVGDTTKKFANVYVSKLTVTKTDGTAIAPSDISKALRVAVVCGSNVYIFAPVSGYTASYKGVIAAGTGVTEGTTISSTVETISTVSATATDNTGLTIGSLNIGATAGAEELTVKVYIWYEGQDGNCTSAKSVNIEGLKINLGFSCTDPVAQ